MAVVSWMSLRSCSGSQTLGCQCSEGAEVRDTECLGGFRIRLRFVLLAMIPYTCWLNPLLKMVSLGLLVNGLWLLLACDDFSCETLQ